MAGSLMRNSSALAAESSLPRLDGVGPGSLSPENHQANGLGQRQVAQQQELIVKLEADGQSAAHAKYLLAGLELLQAARRDSRDKLLKRLDEVK